MQERLVCYGARSLGTIVRAVGFESENELHQRIKDWLLFLTINRHIQIAGFSIHSLGDLGIPPVDVQLTLEKLIVGPKRNDDLATISCRGTAFRVLAAIDRKLAAKFIDSAACNEYVEAMHRWIDKESDDPTLHADLRWLRPG